MPMQLRSSVVRGYSTVQYRNSLDTVGNLNQTNQAFTVLYGAHLTCVYVRRYMMNTYYIRMIGIRA
jgi:hypothetical protein